MPFRNISEAYSRSRLFKSYEQVRSYWDRFKTESHTGSEYIEKWLQQSDVLETLSRQNRACVLLWDAQKNRFIYAVDNGNVLGDDASRYTEADGVHYAVSRYPTLSLEAGMMMQQIGIEYCIAHRDRVKCILLCHDIDYMRGNDCIHVLQQVTVLETADDGHPLLYLCFVYDISHLKKPGTSSLVINTESELLLYNYDFKRQKVGIVPPFTDKEQQVLLMLSAGKNTKEISVQLFSSPHTIDTHRRNLLAKTNCVDTTALVTYCKMVGVL